MAWDWHGRSPFHLNPVCLLLFNFGRDQFSVSFSSSRAEQSDSHFFIIQDLKSLKRNLLTEVSIIHSQKGNKVKVEEKEVATYWVRIQIQ